MSATTKIVNGVEVPLTPAEAAAIEAEWQANTPLTPEQQAAADLVRLREAAKAVFADTRADLSALAKAVRALALVMLDEINILRQAAGLPPRTADQLKAAIRNRIDSGAIDGVPDAVRDRVQRPD